MRSTRFYQAAVCIALAIITCSSFIFQRTDAKPKMYFIALFVKNVDSSVAWYTKVYDLKQRNRTDNPVRGFKQVNLVNGNMFVELVELTKGLDQSTLLKNTEAGSRVNGFCKAGFLVDNIENAQAALKALNVKFNGAGIFTDPVNNKKGFQVLDPDGNILQYFEK